MVDMAQQRDGRCLAAGLLNYRFAQGIDGSEREPKIDEALLCVGTNDIREEGDLSRDLVYEYLLGLLAIHGRPSEGERQLLTFEQPVRQLMPLREESAVVVLASAVDHRQVAPFPWCGGVASDGDRISVVVEFRRQESQSRFGSEGDPANELSKLLVRVNLYEFDIQARGDPHEQFAHIGWQAVLSCQARDFPATVVNYRDVGGRTV